jgi:selenocysteine-specific elongation factor
LIAEHGLIDAARFEMLTGDRRAPTLGRWIVAPDHLETLREQVRQLVGAVGPIGLDVATLTEPQRLVAESLDDIEIRSGRARPAGSHDHLAEHPILAVLAAGGFTPPAPDGVDRAELRQLARRALIVERDGIWFHPAAIDAAAALCVALLAEHREGFTVAEFRDAVGATRKYVLPLLNELDGRGVTRRRGDLRIGGPRLPG